MMQRSVTSLIFVSAIAGTGATSAYVDDDSARQMQIHFQAQSPMDGLCLNDEDELNGVVQPDKKSRCHSQKISSGKGQHHDKKRFGYGHGYGKRK